MAMLMDLPRKNVYISSPELFLGVSPPTSTLGGNVLLFDRRELDLSAI